MKVISVAHNADILVDTYQFHEYSNVPKGLMVKEDIISWNKAKDELSKIFYSGATKKGKY